MGKRGVERYPVRGGTVADIYDEMMEVCKRLAASLPPPCFYESCAQQLDKSRSIYGESSLLSQCRNIAMVDFGRNPSHGPVHAEKVAIEAGALALAEGATIPLPERLIYEAAAFAQVAGVLHDMRRGDEDHARSGAVAAGNILEGLRMPWDHRRYIVEAIANHEAFTQPQPIDSIMGRLVSNVLYDADKFRWGPDNFTATLWEMLRFSRAPVIAVIPRFPEGMAGISRIKNTFRSNTGRTYGPEFIDLGLALGDEIYTFLKVRFAGELKQEISRGE
jgi:hypothetical protein